MAMEVCIYKNRDEVYKAQFVKWKSCSSKTQYKICIIQDSLVCDNYIVIIPDCCKVLLANITGDVIIYLSQKTA